MNWKGSKHVTVCGIGSAVKIKFHRQTSLRVAGWFFLHGAVLEIRPYAILPGVIESMVEIDFSKRQPLLQVSAVGWLLHMDALRVIQACESGALAWAFDLAEPAAHKRSLRVWRGSVCDHLATGGRSSGADVAASAVLCDILPNRHPFSSEITRLFGIHRTSLADFISAGQIRVISPARAKYGVEAACKLDRESLVKFLAGRRVGAM